MNKNLLFIGGPVDAVPALAHAERLGYRPMVVDGDFDAPGLVWARENGQPWALASTYDAHRVVEATERELPRPDGVLSVAVDNAAVVSLVARRLGLPHVGVDASILSWTKPELKLCLQQADLAVPGHPVPRQPYVVKPAFQGRGARDVRLWNWWHRDVKVPPGMIAEQFIRGDQISIESVVWEGRVVFTAMTDRHYDFDRTRPYVVELGGSGPSRWHDTITGHAVEAAVQTAAETLGLCAGTIKCDFVLNEDWERLPTIIEAAVGRISGGLMASHYTPLSFGIDFLAACFALVCGDDPRPCLEQKHEPLYTYGRYDPRRQPTHNKERGRFMLGVGRTLAEARAGLEEPRVWK